MRLVGGIAQKNLNNWYTIETQPIDPFVLEGLPLFTIFLFRG